VKYGDIQVINNYQQRTSMAFNPSQYLKYLSNYTYNPSSMEGMTTSITLKETIYVYIFLEVFMSATLVVFMKEWLDINLMEDVVRLGICKHRRRFNHM
jgi:hypothetical protein